MKTLLVIGAGYVGGELVRQARLADWRVIPVTKNGGDGNYSADITSLESVRALKGEVKHVDVIVHCASSGRGGADAYKAVFRDGVNHLVEVFSGVPIVFVSSTSVYAQMDGSVVTEESEVVPSRETGKILIEAESIVRSKGGIVARLAGIYGFGRSVLIKRLVNGEASIEEDGRRIINQIHRDDAASALLFLAEKLTKGEGSKLVFNVSDSNPRSQKETYEGLCGVFDLDLPPVGEIDYNRKRGWTNKAVSNAKILSFGWMPKYPDFLEVADEIRATL